MKIVIIDYHMGNIQSAANAFAVMGYNVIISDKAKDFIDASHLVLPGVGAFEKGMKNLKDLRLIEPLMDEVIKKKKLFLGICLGMQLLCDESYENGVHNGLGWVSGKVRCFNKNIKELRIPHIGWNEVNPAPNSILFLNLQQKPIFYFVHSYHCVIDLEGLVTARCNYGEEFIASFQKDNIFATQFHPEKSQLNGLQLLKNFVECKGYR